MKTRIKHNNPQSTTQIHTLLNEHDYYQMDILEPMQDQAYSKIKKKTNKSKPQSEKQSSNKANTIVNQKNTINGFVGDKRIPQNSTSHKRASKKKDDNINQKNKVSKDDKKNANQQIFLQDNRDNNTFNLHEAKQNKNYGKSQRNKEKSNKSSKIQIKNKMKQTKPVIKEQKEYQINIYNKKQNSHEKYYKNTKRLTRNGNNMALDLDFRNKKLKSNHTTQRLGDHKSPNLGEKLFNLNPSPSYRQYCIIKGKFVPLQSSTQRKCLDKLLLETACTSPVFGIKELQNSHNFHSKITTQHNNAGFLKQKELLITHQQIGVETIKTELAHYEVLVKAAHQDIGIQYSDRNPNSFRGSIPTQRQILEKMKKQIQHTSKQKNNDIFKQQNVSDKEMIFEVMMKLQSIQLNKNEAFQMLNIDQKRHFRQICCSLLSKMVSPRVENHPMCSRNTDEFTEIAKLKNKKNQSTVQSQLFTKNQQLQQLLMMRQSRQTNQFNVSLRTNSQIDTSMLSVIAMLADIFCYAQINYEQNLLQTMNSLYGLSYTDKYKCVSKYYSQVAQNKSAQKQNNTLSIANRVKIQVLKRQSLNKALPDSLFYDFIKQVGQEENLDQLNFAGNDTVGLHDSSFRKIHTKAIFDCINQLLIPYRPFYPTKGDPFPWTFSPLKCLTFYSIDSQSLETVVQQIQQKLVKYVKFLCGIHIQPNYYVAQQYREKQQNQSWGTDIVFCTRRDKMSKLIIDECQNQQLDDPYLQLQIENTCVMQELSILIFESLLHQTAIELDKRNIKQLEDDDHQFLF